MSKEITTGGSDKVYYSIVGGTFVTKVPQGHPDAKERINKLGKQVFEREVGGIEGKIVNIEVEPSDYGPQLKITTSANSDGKFPVIGIGLETKHGRELLRKIPSLDFSQDVRFIPYKFTPEGADDAISGINLFQNDLKIQSFFWDAEKKVFKNNHPTINWDDATESQKKIYKIERDEFLKNHLTKHILPKFEVNKTEKIEMKGNDFSDFETPTEDEIHKNIPF
jgi:hypothetical protein